MGDAQFRALYYSFASQQVAMGKQKQEVEAGESMRQARVDPLLLSSTYKTLSDDGFHSALPLRSGPLQVWAVLGNDGRRCSEPCELLRFAECGVATAIAKPLPAIGHAQNAEPGSTGLCGAPAKALAPLWGSTRRRDKSRRRLDPTAAAAATHCHHHARAITFLFLFPFGVLVSDGFKS